LLHTVPANDERSLFTLVENRTSYSFDTCELNLFETHRQAENVHLMFDHFVLTSMLSGKKVMKLPNKEGFDYLPGESVILSPGELMKIDFPEARHGNPTQCMALSISNDVIYQTIDKLRELHPKDPDWGEWEIDPSMYHLDNTHDLSDTINRILRISRSEQGKVKDLMVELTLQEMMVRLMQTQARVLFNSSYRLLSGSNALAACIKHIRENLSGKIDMDKLANIACMSRASFFKKFKEAMGFTPSQYIIKERIKLAEEMLGSTQASITQVCFSTGFENLSHFIKAFKMETGMTPKSYQLSHSRA
jgi:AraC-like DNA-binding protein